MTRSPSATLASPAGNAAAVASPDPPRSRPVQALTLAEPLPGFPGHRAFVLVPAEPSGRLFWLQSVAPEGPRFLAVPATSYFPDYAPAVPPAVWAELDPEHAAEGDVYCLVTIPAGDIDAATANLRAPLVVNPATARARQVVLADGRHPIRRPLRR